MKVEYFAGVDVGSVSAESVIIDSRKRMVGSAVLPTGASASTAGENTMTAAAREAGIDISSIACTVATGYGRVSIPFADKKITEITCHAKGAAYLFPNTRTIIDIGGQDSKVILIEEDGVVSDFSMNDKCAAGTGRFLEVMAGALESDLASVGSLASESRKKISISNMCTVFAESEVISLIAAETPPSDIAAGVCDAIARRIKSQVFRLGALLEITMTGGVANNSGVVRALEALLDCRLNIPDEPQMTGAIGAALLAMDTHRKISEKA